MPVGAFAADSTADAPQASPRKRRPVVSAQEQARRKAWGKLWGAKSKAFGKQVREET